MKLGKCIKIRNIVFGRKLSYDQNMNIIYEFSYFYFFTILYTYRVYGNKSLCFNISETKMYNILYLCPSSEPFNVVNDVSIFNCLLSIDDNTITIMSINFRRQSTAFSL